jgi:hypothetical protein
MEPSTSTNQPNLLDQFLVNKNMAADGSPLRALADTIDILRFPGMTDPGDYPNPCPSAAWETR